MDQRFLNSNPSRLLVVEDSLAESVIPLRGSWCAVCVRPSVTAVIRETFQVIGAAASLFSLSLSVLIIARLSASLHFIYLLMVKYWWHSPPFLFLLWRTLSSSSPRNKLRRWWKGFSVCDCFLFFWNLAGVSNVLEEVCSEEEMQLRLQWPTVLTEFVSYHI